MRDKTWTGISWITGIAVFIFIVVMIFGFIEYAEGFDYKYAAIGAVGSIIGGSLTLVGVQITLYKQRNEKFISDFPRMITYIDRIKSEISRINSKNHSYISYINDYYEKDRKEYFTDLKKLSINTDGNIYFIIRELEKEIDNYFNNIRPLMIYTADDEHDYSSIRLTDDSRKNLDNAQDSLLTVIQSTIDKINEYEAELTKKFFNVMK